MEQIQHVLTTTVVKTALNVGTAQTKLLDVPMETGKKSHTPKKNLRQNITGNAIIR